MGRSVFQVWACDKHLSWSEIPPAYTQNSLEHMWGQMQTEGCPAKVILLGSHSFLKIKKKSVERLTGAENLSNGLQQSVNCPSLQCCFVKEKPEGRKQRKSSLENSADCTLLQAERYLL